METVEIVGLNPDLCTHLTVEGGSQFKPSIIDPDSTIGVKDKDVAHDVGKFFRGLVVFDIGKVEFSRYFENPHHGREEGSFGDAKAFTSAQNFAGPIIFRMEKGGVGVVLDLVSDKKEYNFDLFAGVADALHKFKGVVAQAWVADIYE